MKSNILLFRPSRTGSARSSETLDAQLRLAIEKKRLVQLEYAGVSRVAEPHDYGLIDAVPRLLIYQRRKAGDASKSSRGWRLLYISDVKDCVVLDDTFAGTRGDAHGHHYDWDVLYARVT